jgi:hypothetical protein
VDLATFVSSSVGLGLTDDGVGVPADDERDALVDGVGDGRAGDAGMLGGRAPAVVLPGDGVAEPLAVDGMRDASSAEGVPSPEQPVTTARTRQASAYTALWCTRSPPRRSISPPRERRKARAVVADRSTDVSGI